ncbi:MAG: MbnP family copper-binding protein [Woeseiaceae bacterium]
MFRRYVTLLTVLVLIASCGESSSRVEIPFAATIGGTPIACNASPGAELTDLRFYVYKLRMIDLDGQEHPITLEAGAWQQTDLAFVDLEDATGGCLNGTTEMNAVIRGTAASRDYRGLTFSVGVPFSRNHGDPLTATAPLGDADMHWHWRGGYKFLRAGIKTDEDSFWIHLGSTGCEGTIRNITGCNAPNRAEIRLSEFRPGDTINIDLAALAGDGALTDGEASDCSSGPAETDCANAFAALGLVHATGDAASAQQVFSLRTRP